MKKNPKILLEHIIDSILSIEEYTEKISKNDFKNDAKTQDAVIRKLEIIGEAVKNLPASFKNKNPEIPWKKIAGTRDVLIHEYFGVDVNMIWIVIKEDIPKLKKQIKKILERYS